MSAVAITYVTLALLVKKMIRVEINIVFVRLHFSLFGLPLWQEQAFSMRIWKKRMEKGKIVLAMVFVSLCWSYVLMSAQVNCQY